MKRQKGPEEIVNSRDFNSAGNYFNYLVLRPILTLECLKQEMEGTEAVLADPVVLHIGS